MELPILLVFLGSKCLLSVDSSGRYTVSGSNESGKDCVF